MSTIPGKSFYISGFDPRTIPGCSLWLDAADATTITFGSGSNVSQWNDKSGNGRNVIQTTVSQQPTYSNTRVNFVTASSQYLQNTTSFSITNTYTIFGVGQQSSSTLGRIVEIRGNPSLVAGFDFGSNYNIFSGNTTDITNSQPTGNTTQNIAVIVRSVPSAQYTLNGGSPVTMPSVAAAFTGQPNTFTVGAAYAVGATGVVSGFERFLNGFVNEIIVYDTALSSNNRQQIEGYLATKWGLTSSLPATHPFRSIRPFTRQFQPVDISGCVLWIDAADATTVTLSGNNITQLTDKTSNAFVFATASGFTYNVVKFNTSYPSFYSPTSTAGFSLGSNASFTLNQPFTAFAVGGNLIAPGSGGYFWDSTSNANRGALLAFNPGTPTMFSGTELFSTNTTSFTSAIILSLYYNTTASTLFEFGVNRSSTSNVGAQNISSLRLGAAWPLSTNWNGHICEIIFFNRLLSTTERQQMEGYLADKWGLRSGLASTHPFKLYPPLSVAFTPVQISELNAWYDGGDRTSFTLSGNTVTTWADKSGNGRNASGGSPGTLASAGGVTFNGSTNYYNVSIPYSSNYSIFLVATNTEINEIYFFGRDAIGGGRWPTFIQGYGTSTRLEWYEGADRATIVDVPISPFIASVDHTQGGRILGYYYGTQTMNIAQTQGYNGTAWDTIGRPGANIAGGWYKGTMKELIFYSNVVTTPQRQAVEGYLAHKWGLLTNLPASHPYKKIRP